MFDRRPQEPTIRMIMGCETSCGSTNRWIASRKMERHSATRKTPLIRAPRVSARCHYSLSATFLCEHAMPVLTPYVYVLEFVFWLATLTAHSPTRRDITSFNCAYCQHTPNVCRQMYPPCERSRQPERANARHSLQSAQRRRRPCQSPAVS